MIEGARGTLSLKNIAHPLPLPEGTELISLTTFDGRLVILTNEGPYIWRDSRWEKVAASPVTRDSRYQSQADASRQKA